MLVATTKKYKTYLNKMKYLSYLSFIILALSCSKTDNSIPPPVTTVVVEKTRLELAQVEFTTHNNLTPKVPLQTQDTQKSNFSTGYVGKLQADEIWKYEVLNNPSINKVKLWVSDNGHLNVYSMFLGKYQKLLQAGIVQLRSYTDWGLVDETTATSYEKNIYNIDGLSPNSTNPNTSHGEIVMKTVFTEGTGFDIDFLSQLADKYPNYGSSPIIIIFEGYMKGTATVPVKNKLQKNTRTLQEVNSSPIIYNISSYSFSPALLQSNGTPISEIQTWIDNSKYLFVNSLPNAGEESSLKENVRAGEYYNKNTKNFIMIGAINSYSATNLSTNYAPYKPVTVSASLFAGDGVNTGTSFATPNTAAQLAKTAMLLPTNIPVATLKTLVASSTMTLPSGEPLLDYGATILEALGKKPNSAEVGPNDSYLLSDQYEIIDPTNKLKIDWKNGKSYINTQSVSTLVGSTVKLVVRIPYTNGKVYFSAVNYLVKNTGGYTPISVIR